MDGLYSTRHLAIRPGTDNQELLRFHGIGGRYVQYVGTRRLSPRGVAYLFDLGAELSPPL